MVAEATSSHLVGLLLELVAHDLRNPLSALHSNVGFLESMVDERDRDAREALTDVTASCGSLKHIIDNLELFGLFVRGVHPELERGPIVLHDLIQEVLSRIQGIAESYGVTVAFNEEPRRDIRIRAHREMLSRALGNLLFNSIQHGGSSVPISLSVFADAKSAGILCTDGGSLLADRLLVDAFTAEGQLTCKTDSFGRYSRGLGLFCARIAADLSGSEVRALPSEDGKNRFELRAPLA
jgi:signal transduction histidine kinase